MRIRNSLKMKTRSDLAYPAKFRLICETIEHNFEHDLAASSWYGLDTGDPAYIRFGAQEHVGANHEFHVPS